MFFPAAQSATQHKSAAHLSARRCSLPSVLNLEPNSTSLRICGGAHVFHDQFATVSIQSEVYFAREGIFVSSLIVVSFVSDHQIKQRPRLDAVR